MTTDTLKIEADKHMALAHGYKTAGDRARAEDHRIIAHHLNLARLLMEAVA